MRRGLSAVWISALLGASGCVGAEPDLGVTEEPVCCGAACCLIEGACYARGDTRRDDPCSECDPSVSQVAWTAVCDGGGAAVDDASVAPDSGPPPCPVGAACAELEDDCGPWSACNTGLSPPRCQRLFCVAPGEPCGASGHCRDGFVCRRAVCVDPLVDAGSPLPPDGGTNEDAGGRPEDAASPASDGGAEPLDAGAPPATDGGCVIAGGPSGPPTVLLFLGWIFAGGLLVRRRRRGAGPGTRLGVLPPVRAAE